MGSLVDICALVVGDRECVEVTVGSGCTVWGG